MDKSTRTVVGDVTTNGATKGEGEQERRSPSRRRRRDGRVGYVASANKVVVDDAVARRESLARRRGRGHWDGLGDHRLCRQVRAEAVVDVATHEGQVGRA